MKNIGKKFFALTMVILLIFIGIFAIFSNFKENEQEEKMSTQISNKNEQQAQMVCKNEKIIKKNIDGSYLLQNRI